MKRFHVNLTVKNLNKSVAFYTELFGCPPTVAKPDYAKWQLEDPRVNFALSTHGLRAGIDHVGIQAESSEELAQIRERLERAGGPIFDQPEVECCYSKSSKAWIRDPGGLAWETFVTHGDAVEYGDGSREHAARLADASPDGHLDGEASCCGAPTKGPTDASCC